MGTSSSTAEKKTRLPLAKNALDVSSKKVSFSGVEKSLLVDGYTRQQSVRAGRWVAPAVFTSQVQLQDTRHLQLP